MSQAEILDFCFVKSKRKHCVSVIIDFVRTLQFAPSFGPLSSALTVEDFAVEWTQVEGHYDIIRSLCKQKMSNAWLQLQNGTLHSSNDGDCAPKSIAAHLASEISDYKRNFTLYWIHWKNSMISRTLNYRKFKEKEKLELNSRPAKLTTMLAGVKNELLVAS